MHITLRFHGLGAWKWSNTPSGVLGGGLHRKQRKVSDGPVSGGLDLGVVGWHLDPVIR